MSPQALIALLVVLIVLAVSMTPPARSFTSYHSHRLRGRLGSRSRPRAASTGTTVITGTGEEVPVPIEPPPAPSLAERLALGQRRGLLVILVYVMIGVLIR